MGHRSLLNRITEHVRNGMTVEELYKHYKGTPTKIIDKIYQDIVKTKSLSE